VVVDVQEDQRFLVKKIKLEKNLYLSRTHLAENEDQRVDKLIHLAQVKDKVPEENGRTGERMPGIADGVGEDGGNVTFEEDRNHLLFKV